MTITRHGKPVAVFLSADDLESPQETVFWLSEPDVRDDIAEAEAEVEADVAPADVLAITGSELRAELGLLG